MTLISRAWFDGWEGHSQLIAAPVAETWSRPSSFSCARSGPAEEAYRRWRQLQITKLVAGARSQIRKVRPSVRLSAAVFGSYPGCADSIGQDWGAWLAGGDIDFACPMDYATDLNQFRTWVQRQAAMPGGSRIFPGIGVTAAESHLNVFQTIDQILALRDEGMRGYALFGLGRTLERETLPALSLGVSR